MIVDNNTGSVDTCIGIYRTGATKYRTDYRIYKNTEIIF